MAEAPGRFDQQSPYLPPTAPPPPYPPQFGGSQPGHIPGGYHEPGGYQSHASYPTMGGFAVPGYYPPQPGLPRRNGLGTAGMICGIASCALSPMAFINEQVIGPLTLAILGLTFGIIGRQRAIRGEATNRDMAVAGITAGAIGIAGVTFFAWAGYKVMVFISQYS